MADRDEPLDATGTAEGETPERPAPTEAGQPGTPGAADHPIVHGSDDHEAHRADAHHPGRAHVEEHDRGHDDHGDSEHGAHGEPRLGPIDWPAWGVSVLGVAIASVMAVLFYLAVAPR